MRRRLAQAVPPARDRRLDTSSDRRRKLHVPPQIPPTIGCMALNHHPKKRFGQNFLHDPAIIDRIVAALDPRPGERLGLDQYIILFSFLLYQDWQQPETLCQAGIIVSN